MITITGVNTLTVNIAAVSRAVKDQAPDVLLKHVTNEVRSREQLGWRKPLDVEGNGLTVAVAWPYPYEGGEGTYVTRITEQAASLMLDALTRDLAEVIGGAV